MKHQPSLPERRTHYQPQIPKMLSDLKRCEIVVEGEPTRALADEAKVEGLFPHTYGAPVAWATQGEAQEGRPLRVGVVFSGGQAPGGHNVITGLYDALKQLNGESELIGILGGPSGLVDAATRVLSREEIDAVRNQGGFDLIGSGRTKLETPEQLEAARQTVEQLKLDGVVVIGGDDSNTNAALLAEFFRESGMTTNVVGVPKTIDGDLKNEWVELSFGHDTACRLYSELIGNISRDVSSAKKYYHFIKLMGRAASHIALECALQTQPTYTLISEEVAERQQTLSQIVDELCTVIRDRAEKGMNYGVVLVPEGLIEFIPEMRDLTTMLSNMLATGSPLADQVEAAHAVSEKIELVKKELKGASLECFLSLPQEIQGQLLWDRDPHGNVQVSRIETEKLLIQMVESRLREWKSTGRYSGRFSGQNHFFGYEGRAGLPTNFDANYCYALGHVAAALLHANKSGYMAFVQNLAQSPQEWKAGGLPITSLLNMEERHGQDKPVIRKALVELQGKAFQYFVAQRKEWAQQDCFLFPGPTQFFGEAELTDLPPLALALETTAKAVGVGV